MSEIFFAYPSGRSGIALLLLRASIVAWLVTTPIPTAFGDRITIASTIITVALSIGFGTRIATGAVALGLLAIRIAGQSSAQTLAVPALDSLALALIGPGAYSVDALIYGRRTVCLRQ